MTFTLSMLAKSPSALPLDKWFWSAYKNVVQFYSHRLFNEKHYMLYLKWKSPVGPWRAFIVENATSADDMLSEKWSPAVEVRQFRLDEVEEAMRVVERAWKQTL